MLFLCFSFTSLPKWPFLTFLRNVTSSLRILKYQNILALTVWPIVPITFLILNNHQSGRLAAKNSNSAEIAFFTFWSNVTYSPDSPVNVLIESRNVRKIDTVSSNRTYKMHEITFIYVTSIHCRIQMASYYITIAFKFSH